MARPRHRISGRNKSSREGVVAPVTTIPITIAAGTSLSGSVPISGNPLALILPNVWDNRAPLTFQMSADNTNFYEVSMWNTDQVSSIPVVANYWTPLNFTQVFPQGGGIYLKLQSGTAAAPVPQSGDRVFTLVTA